MDLLGHIDALLAALLPSDAGGGGCGCAAANDAGELRARVRAGLQEAEARLVAARQAEARIRGQHRALCAGLAQWHGDFFSSKTREETDLEQFFLQP